MSLTAVILTLIVVVPLVIALSRANELFCLRVTGGRVRVVRGRVPQALVNDIADVLRSPRVEEATVRGLSEGGRAVIVAKARGPIDEGQRQRLRNVIARWPVARIRTSSRAR